MEILRTVKRTSPETEIVVTTASATLESALEAVKAGAYDYIAKPFQPQALLMTGRRALEHKSLVQKVSVLEQAMEGRASLDGLIGTSPAMTEVLKMVKQVARLDSPILISGESGTGKELVGRALHAFSPRKDKRLIIINCGAIPENLRESELFGHAKGAFAGAHVDKRGLLEEANGTSSLRQSGQRLVGFAQPTENVREFLLKPSIFDMVVLIGMIDSTLVTKRGVYLLSARTSFDFQDGPVILALEMLVKEAR